MNTGNKSCHWTGYGEIHGGLWYSIKDNAKRRNFDFKLTIEEAWDLFLKQNRNCALSGSKLKFGRTSKSLKTASLDRIDSSKGYFLKNVQWVHKDVNNMKMSLTQKRFLEMCKLIYLNNK